MSSPQKLVDAGDLNFNSVAEPEPSRRRRWIEWVAATAVLVAFAFTAASWMTNRTAAEVNHPLVRLEVELKSNGVLGSEVGTDVVLSPDGNRVVFASRNADGQAYLVATGDDRNARGGADWGVGVGLRKLGALSGDPIDLTAKEFDLLLQFARNPGRVYTRAQLLDLVWGYGHDGYEHTVNSHINRLRNKLEKDSARPAFILTVWGVGYKFADA